jgi:lysosomal acid phosphatase
MLLTALVLAVAAAMATATEDELRFVIVIYRHGDRTPVASYVTDPYKDPSNWPVGLGQLTSRGKKMQYELGQYLRQRYGSFLGEEYSEKRLYVQSSDVDRTLMSAQCNLAALFPPKGQEVWNPTLPWQPIPVHTLPESEDNLLTSHAYCPRMTELIAEVLDSPEVAAINSKYDWLYKYVSEHTQENITDMINVDYIYDTLLIEQLYNKTLPEWTKRVFPEEMKYLRDLSFTVTTWTPELKRLRAGPLISNIAQTLKKAKSGTLDPVERKMVMYSGHDTTLSSLLNGLGMFGTPLAPTYASLLAIELRKNNDGQFYVTVDYRNDTSRDPYLLSLPGCESSCPLEKFDSLTRHLQPQHWQTECKSQKDAALALVTYTSLGICFVLLLGLTVAVIIHCLKSKRVGNQSRYFSIYQQDA